MYAAGGWRRADRPSDIAPARLSQHQIDELCRAQSDIAADILP